MDLYLNGTKLQHVCETYPNVPKRTITHCAKRKKNIEKRRPGPQPLLLENMEKNLKPG